MKRKILSIFKYIFWQAKDFLSNKSTDKLYKRVTKGLTIKHLTQGQKREICSYWQEHLGIKPDIRWYEYAYSLTGKIDKRFVPQEIWEPYILRSCNDMLRRKSYDDKNMFSRILPEFAQPKQIVFRQNGLFYSSNSELITKQKAIELCYNIPKAIIKPTVGSCCGHNVNVLQIKDGKTNINNKTAEEVFDMYGDNFKIENFINQHSDMTALNPSSVQTLRVMSFLFEDRAVVLGAVCRIGKPGNCVDNYSAGGVACWVNKDGYLSEKAYGEKQSATIEKTSTGIVLKDFKIPGWENVVCAVTRAHTKMPYFRLLGFDVAIAEDCQPILVEYNIGFGHLLALGMGQPIFGEYTEEILPIIKQLHEKRKKQSLFIC